MFIISEYFKQIFFILEIELCLTIDLKQKQEKNVVNGVKMQEEEKKNSPKIENGAIQAGDKCVINMNSVIQGSNIYLH